MEGPNIKNWKVLLEESMFASKNHDRAVLRAIWGLRHPMSFLSISPLTKSRKTNMNKRHMYIPGAQMTLVWLEKMLKHLRQFSWDWSLSKKATHTNLLNPLCFCFKLTYIYMYICYVSCFFCVPFIFQNELLFQHVFSLCFTTLPRDRDGNVQPRNDTQDHSMGQPLEMVASTHLKNMLIKLDHIFST